VIELGPQARPWEKASNLSFSNLMKKTQTGWVGGRVLGMTWMLC
jgi:hypothetical protein